MKEAGSFMDSRTAHLFFQVMAPVMDSPWRTRFFDPVTILEAAGIRAGQEVLEIGCGTGFFTLPAAELVGHQGRLYAVDPHPLAIERVTQKVQAAGLTNVRLIRGDAMAAGLANGCIDLVLLFGVIPSPVVPLDRLVPELHRLLRAEGALAVWTAIPWWSPASLTRNGLFVSQGKERGVHNFRKAAPN